MTEARYLKRLYWQSFAVRFGAGFLGWFLTVVIGIPMMEDALNYEQQGVAVAHDWLQGRSSILLDEAIEKHQNGWMMIAVMAACYTVMGGIRALPVLIAVYCLITSWTPVLTYRIARKLGQQPGGARIGAMLVAFSPAFAFWSGALYKEGLILLTLNLMVYHTLLLQEDFRPRSILWLCVSLVGLMGLRFYLAIVMSIILGAGLVLGKTRRKAGAAAFLVPLRQGLILGFAGMALLLVGFNDSVRSQMPSSTEEALGKIERSRRDLATYQSGYQKDVELKTAEQAIAFLPIGTAYFLTVPLPWHIGSLRQNLAIPETFCWILLYPMILRGMRRGLKQQFQGTVLIIVITGVVTLLYGVFAGNIGTVYRMRIQVWLFWSIFVGWGRKQHQTQPVRRMPQRALTAV